MFFGIRLNLFYLIWHFDDQRLEVFLGHYNTLFWNYWAYAAYCAWFLAHTDHFKAVEACSERIVLKIFGSLWPWVINYLLSLILWNRALLDIQQQLSWITHQGYVDVAVWNRVEVGLLYRIYAAHEVADDDVCLGWLFKILWFEIVELCILIARRNRNQKDV